jgi:hypothetical protein
MGGGSGGAGKTDWPAYMTIKHDTWMQLLEIDRLVAAAANPWAPYSAYDPDVELTAMIGAVNDYLAFLNTVTTDLYINAAAAAFDASLTATIDATAIARFEAGMRNINAVNSSAFVVGKAIIYARKNEQVATFSASLRLDTFLKLADTRRVTYQMMIDVQKMKIIAKKEEYESQIESDVKEAVWELELYKFGANMLSSIGGASQVTGPSGPSKTTSALGGAMTGAAVGAMVTPAAPYVGAIVGGLIGGVGGYMAGS